MRDVMCSELLLGESGFVLVVANRVIMLIALMLDYYLVFIDFFIDFVCFFCICFLFASVSTPLSLSV